MSPMVGAVLGGAVAVGGWMVQSGWSRRRRPGPWIRVVPYIRDVRPGPDGLLYVLTDENPGVLLRIEPAE